MSESYKSFTNKNKYITIIGLFFCIQSLVSISASANEIISFEDGLPINLTNCDNLNWYIDHSNGNKAPPSLHSGPITGLGTSSVCKVISNGPADLEFWWKIDRNSESVGDLSFFVDGKKVVTCRSSYWSPVTYSLSEGEHVLRWEYTKFRSYPEGIGAGWIDDITISFRLKKISKETVSDNVSARYVYLINESVSRFENNVSQLRDSITRIEKNISRIENKLNDFDHNLRQNISKLEGNISRIAGTTISKNDTVYVDTFDDVKKYTFRSVYDALYFVKSGGKIKVSSGLTLHDNVVLYKPVTFIGDAKIKPIIKDHGIYIMSNDVSVKNFVVENYTTGISLLSTSNVSLEANNISKCHYGVYLENCTGNKGRQNLLIANNISKCDIGLWILNSKYFIAKYNNIMDIIEGGIFMEDSYNVTINQNTISDVNVVGICLLRSGNNTFGENILKRLDDGFKFRSGCTNNIIDETNTIDANSCDIYLEKMEDIQKFTPPDKCKDKPCGNCPPGKCLTCS